MGVAGTGWDGMRKEGGRGEEEVRKRPKGKVRGTQRRAGGRSSLARWTRTR